MDLNATQAAIRAGYSIKTATKIASENLTKPDIQKAVQAALKAREKRTEVTQDYVIAKLREIVEKAQTVNSSMPTRFGRLSCWASIQARLTRGYPLRRKMLLRMTPLPRA